MPVIDNFPGRLREECEAAYDEDLDEVFDVGSVRQALETRLKTLESELHQVHVVLYVVLCVVCMWFVRVYCDAFCVYIYCT